MFYHYRKKSKLRFDKGNQNLRAVGLKGKQESNFFHLEDCHPLVVGLCNLKKKKNKFAINNVHVHSECPQL